MIVAFFGIGPLELLIISACVLVPVIVAVATIALVASMSNPKRD